MATITYSTHAGIARLTLDQPTRHNAMRLAMWQSLPTLLAQAAADPAIRAVTLEGAGRQAFSAGADISEFPATRTGEAAVEAYDHAVSQAAASLLACELPTIALIRGFCFGGGMALAMCCDLRLADETARFRIPAGRLGVGYGWDEIAPVLDRLGPTATAEILFTARIFDAADAARLGITQATYPPESFAQSAEAYLAAIAENAPLTLRATKRALIERTRPNPDRAAVDRLVAACFASDDYREGQAAFREKRVPRFTGH